MNKYRKLLIVDRPVPSPLCIVRNLTNPILHIAKMQQAHHTIYNMGGKAILVYASTAEKCTLEGNLHSSKGPCQEKRDKQSCFISPDCKLCTFKQVSERNMLEKKQWLDRATHCTVMLYSQADGNLYIVNGESGTLK